jgi:hypothetical protein
VLTVCRDCWQALMVPLGCGWAQATCGGCWRASAARRVFERVLMVRGSCWRALIVSGGRGQGLALCGGHESVFNTCKWAFAALGGAGGPASCLSYAQG